MSPADWSDLLIQPGLAIYLVAPNRIGKQQLTVIRYGISLREIALQNYFHSVYQAWHSLLLLRGQIYRTRGFLYCSYLDLSLKYTVPNSYYFLSLCCERSIMTAIKITSPLTTCCQNGETPNNTRPLFSTPIITAPSTVPIIKPRPPDKDVPPITTAAIASNS